MRAAWNEKKDLGILESVTLGGLVVHTEISWQIWRDLSFCAQIYPSSLYREFCGRPCLKLVRLCACYGLKLPAGQYLLEQYREKEDLRGKPANKEVWKGHL